MSGRSRDFARWSLAIAVCVTAWLGWQYASEAPPRRAQEAVRKALRDPESAQFTDVRIAVDGVVCGFVNSKNGFGAYGGPKPFAVSRHGIVEVEADDAPPSMMVRNECRGVSAARQREIADSVEASYVGATGQLRKIRELAADPLVERWKIMMIADGVRAKFPGTAQAETAAMLRAELESQQGGSAWR